MSMESSNEFKGYEQEIEDLVTSVFTASEGAEEGALIGTLSRELMGQTPDRDLRVKIARIKGQIVGVIFFSRLVYEMDKRIVFVLGPVAVATGHQRQGVGKRLISYGLDSLREEAIDIALTYGDPSYYKKVGFQSIKESFAAAPFPLQHPEGWMGQSLTSVKLTPLLGRSECVEALNKQSFW